MHLEFSTVFASSVSQCDCDLTLRYACTASERHIVESPVVSYLLTLARRKGGRERQGEGGRMRSHLGNCCRCHRPSTCHSCMTFLWLHFLATPAVFVLPDQTQLNLACLFLYRKTSGLRWIVQLNKNSIFLVRNFLEKLKWNFLRVP